MTEPPLANQFSSIADAILGPEKAKLARQLRIKLHQAELAQARRDIRNAQIRMAIDWSIRVVFVLLALTTASGIDILIWQHILH